MFFVIHFKIKIPSKKFANPQICTLTPCWHLSLKLEALNKADQLGAWTIVGTEGSADGH